MIPTKTGAAAAVGLVLPELNGKLDGFSMRVPTINVSVVDLCFVAKRATTNDEINEVMKEAANGALKGILGYTNAPLVSVDFNHDPHSSLLRRDPDQGHRRHAGEGLLVVRQRVGLLQPHARHHGRLVEGGLIAPWLLWRMLRIWTLRDKRVLIREDLNVPVKGGKVTSDARIEARRCRRIKRAHDDGRARPGHVAPGARRKRASRRRVLRSRRWRSGFASCWPQGAAASELAGWRGMRARRSGAAARTCASTWARRRTRKHLAKKMAELCDVFVMDAFGTAHRAKPARTAWRSSPRSPALVRC